MSVEAELEESVSYTPIQRMRHSAAYVMAEAVLEIFPDAKLAIGPAIEDGFYQVVSSALEGQVTRNRARGLPDLHREHPNPTGTVQCA